MSDLAGMSSSESSGTSDISLDVSPSSACNEVSAVGTSVDIAGSEICTVSSASLSQGISGRESVGKGKSAESVLPRVSDAGNALVGPTTFSSKMTSRRI